MNPQDLDESTVKPPMLLATMDCKRKMDNVSAKTLPSTGSVVSDDSPTSPNPPSSSSSSSATSSEPQNLTLNRLALAPSLVQRGVAATTDQMRIEERIREKIWGANHLPVRRSNEDVHFVCEPEVPARNCEGYQDASSDIATLKNLVNDFMTAGNDGEAIALVTQELIEDNGLPMSLDVPLFCLNTLWVLARKSDENKRKIIFEGAILETIVEAMFLYRDAAAEIQRRACALLWTLSVDVRDRVHVAQSGACDAVLRAMKTYAEDVSLQVMALECLKALSSSHHSKTNLCFKKTSSTVADVMRNHAHEPSVQAEGCVVLGNLAVSDADHFVRTVTEKEISAVVNAMRANPEELEVHEAACFALLRLASSTANVELMRGNGLSRATLEQAFEKHPDKVGNSILILLRRLRFHAPAAEIKRDKLSIKTKFG